MVNNCIKLVNLSKSIKNNTILDNINLTLHGGNAYGIVGINGSGKTMFLRLLSGLLIRSSGEIFLNGIKIKKEVYKHCNVGFLIEKPAFLENYTGYENLKFLYQAGINGNLSEIEELLESVGLDPKDRRKYKKYSLGMKQKLGIAASVLGNPELLLWDEPTNALDQGGIQKVDALLQKQLERGTVIVIASHEREFLVRSCDTIVELEKGKIVRVKENRRF